MFSLQAPRHKGETAVTTAQLRNAAYDAAAAMNWDEAARLYDAAAAQYPMQHGRTSFGALAASDIATLRGKADACRAMVQA